MPILQSNFKGNRFFKNKHVETILPTLFRYVSIHFKRKRILLADGDFLDLDWITNSSKNLLILFHGLEGSSQSQYIKGFSKYFSQQNFDVCVVNFRGCSGEMNLKLRSYHSGASDDISEVINQISSDNLYESIFLCGFSLGGNALLKYLGEESVNINLKIKSAATFSVPVDLAASSKALAKGSNKIYMHRFLKSMNKKILKKAKLFSEKLNTEGIEKIKTFADWDSRFTAPIHGFIDSTDYYQKCSSKQFLHQIKIPTLLVNALNDPFLSEECFPFEIAKKSEYFYLEATQQGGHVGFSKSFPNKNYWSEERAYSFFSSYL